MSNRGGTYVNLGASNHCDHDRAEKDYYSTDPKATELLMKREVFCHNIAEPCVGGGRSLMFLSDMAIMLLGVIL